MCEFHNNSSHTALSVLPLSFVPPPPSTHVDMQRYRWPDYEMKLLEELQKQQHNARFCDTLLQTEGEDELCGNL